MALNHYVTLRNSGLRVSPLCLGAMTFGEDWGWGSSVAESEAIIARFLERGGNFIDTAPSPDRLHQSVLDALLGHVHADRGNAAGARRSRAGGEGPLRRVLEHAGVEGVTPWSPLRSGALSGKYTRTNAGQVTADRGV